MTYNSRNYFKKIRRWVEIYNKHKTDDVTDAHIVKNIFPKYDIHISYRTWMDVKGRPIPKVDTEEKEITEAEFFNRQKHDF